MRRKIIEQFVEAINQQNVPRLIEMMAEDFQFIDTYGKSENKEAMKSGWPGYFEWFPDYQIDIEESLANESCVILIGGASGSYLGQAEKQWAFPAAWKVVAADQQIKIWQVFCDSKKQLDSMK